MSSDVVGQILDGRYRVIESIGKGAMGSVYRGERINLGRVVAIKFLQEEIPNDASRQRFEREAMAMARLEHPHCGSVLDVGVHDGKPYVVMEFVSGQNLKELLTAGPLPVARAVEITKQVLSGLSHAHELGIIHRDIKPANIVLSQKSGMGDFAKILDFGLARFNKEASNLTGAMVLGTPNYMAPEQIRGGALDHRGDLYSCGVMLFELLTGQKPFSGNDPVAICMAHLNQPVPRMQDKAPGRSFGTLEEVVARALAKDPAQRFASAEEFSRALTDAASSRPGTPPPISEPTAALPSASLVETVASPAHAVAPTPSRRRLALLAAGGLVLAVVAVVLATRSSDAPAAAPTPAPVAAAPADAAVAAEVDPAAELLARAADLTSAGRREPALDLLLKARKTYPSNARIAYEASKLYLEKMWWADGLKQARDALALDPAYKSDPTLIKLVLRGFNTTKSYDWTLAKFLHDDIGSPAKPFLEEAAASHPNPIVRNRVKSELRRY